MFGDWFLLLSKLTSQKPVNFLMSCLFYFDLSRQGLYFLNIDEGGVGQPFSNIF